MWIEAYKSNTAVRREMNGILRSGAGPMDLPAEVQLDSLRSSEP